MRNSIKISIFISFLISTPLLSQVNEAAKKVHVIDFSAGVIEGELNRPSMLLEIGDNFKDLDDLLFLREDFNSFHQVDSKIRFRYIEEKNE